MVCNCGCCRRVAALWAYGSVPNFLIEGGTVANQRGDRALEFHHCSICGEVRQGRSVLAAGSEGYGRRAVNTRLAEPRLVLGRPVERLEGADTWRSLPPGELAEAPLLSL